MIWWRGKGGEPKAKATGLKMEYGFNKLWFKEGNNKWKLVSWVLPCVNRGSKGGVKIQLSLSAHIITKGLYTTSSKMLQIYNVRIQQVYNDTMDLQTVSEVKQVELFWSPWILHIVHICNHLGSQKKKNYYAHEKYLLTAAAVNKKDCVRICFLVLLWPLHCFNLELVIFSDVLYSL